MGLDLFHAIPSVKTDDTLEYFTLDEFADNPKFLESYSHLLTEINDVDYGFEMLVYPDNITKELVTNRTPNYRTKPSMIGNINELTTELKEVGAQNSVINAEPLILKAIDNILSNESSREVYYHTAYFETASKKIKVLYRKEKGYKRKAMNPQFYKDFENCKLYFDKASVLKASSYLIPASDSNLQELTKHFRNNFIDNFVEGQSIFWGSW